MQQIRSRHDFVASEMFRLKYIFMRRRKPNIVLANGYPNKSSLWDLLTDRRVEGFLYLLRPQPIRVPVTGCAVRRSRGVSSIIFVICICLVVTSALCGAWSLLAASHPDTVFYLVPLY
jgi:hypothetical protein